MGGWMDGRLGDGEEKLQARGAESPTGSEWQLTLP